MTEIPKQPPKNITIVNGMIVETAALPQQQEAQTIDVIQSEDSNNIPIFNYSINIYVFYLLIIVISVFFLGWKGIVVGVILSFISSLILI